MPGPWSRSTKKRDQDQALKFNALPPPIDVWGELQRIVPSPDRSRLQELRDLQSELLSSLEQRLQEQLLAATPHVSTSTTTPEGTPPLI